MIKNTNKPRAEDPARENIEIFEKNNENNVLDISEINDFKKINEIINNNIKININKQEDIEKYFDKRETGKMGNCLFESLIKCYKIDDDSNFEIYKNHYILNLRKIFNNLEK